MDGDPGAADCGTDVVTASRVLVAAARVLVGAAWVLVGAAWVLEVVVLVVGTGLHRKTTPPPKKQ